MWKPWIQASPLLGISRVVRHLIRVVLPAPLGPSRPKISPWEISSETCRRASTRRTSDRNSPRRSRGKYSLDSPWICTSISPILRTSGLLRIQSLLHPGQALLRSEPGQLQRRQRSTGGVVQDHRTTLGREGGQCPPEQSSFYLTGRLRLGQHDEAPVPGSSSGQGGQGGPQPCTSIQIGRAH